MAKKDDTEAADAPRNIAWVGTGDLPHTLNYGMEPTITMPDGLTESDARAGFHHPRAGLILANDDRFRPFAEDKGKVRA